LILADVWTARPGRKNLADATRMWRVVKMARRDAKGFPDVDEGILDATWTTGYEYGDEPRAMRKKSRIREHRRVYRRRAAHCATTMV
jgi:hypothetical protein